MTDNIDPTASQAFAYDDLGRLDSAEGAYGVYSWEYDKVGNRRTQSADGVFTTYRPGNDQLHL